MKLNSFLLSISLIFLASCSFYTPYAGSSVDFPLRPEKNVEVFYPDELLPYKEYVTVGGLSVREGLEKSETYYVNRLRNMAHKAGIDALINVRKTVNEQEYGDEITYFNSYTATGIKYIENIDYLDKYVREESFFTVNSSASTRVLSGIIQRTPSGRILSSRFMDDDAHSVYKLYVQEFRDYHLMEEQANWSYKMDMYNNVPLFRRYCRDGGWKIKTCKYHYKNDRLNWINIDYHDRDADTRVYFTYFKDGRIAKRELVLTHNRKIIEKYHYDTLKRLSWKEYEILSTLTSFSQKYVSEYTYYAKEDIYDFIEQ